MERQEAPAVAYPFQVRSTDGTSLAVWSNGSGPPLVLVHGAMSDHTIDGPLVDELAGGMTTFAMDRRGRGGSGDAEEYSIQREFEDVAAVVDEVAARTGQPVALWGHSYGADCAMGGATLTDAVHRLVLYEPGLGMRYPPGSVEAVEATLAAGEVEAAAVALLVGVVEATEEEVELIRSNPTWPVRLETVPTTPRELRAEGGWVYEPDQFANVVVPTLLLAGSDSPPAQSEATRQAAAAIPIARVEVLERHGHIAHRSDPSMVAALIRHFVLS